jgi:hypothetical protein
MAYVQDRYRYYVASYTGAGMRAAAPPGGFAGGGQAKASARQRLGVERLRDERKTVIPEPSRIRLPYDGAVWESDWMIDYAAFPPSHPEAKTSGGVRLYRMVRVVADIPDEGIVIH